MKDIISSIFTMRTLHASTLTMALLVSFFFNFLFNVYLGRVLSFTDFGVIAFISSFWLIVIVFLNSLGLTLNRFLVTIRAQKSVAYAEQFFSDTTRTGLIISIFFTFLWILLAQPIKQIFSLTSAQTVLFLSPLFTAGVLATLNRAYIQSFYKFPQVGIILVAESVFKLLLAVTLVSFALESYVYISIPLSVIFAYVVSVFFMKREKVNLVVEHKEPFPIHFYIASVMSSLAMTLLFTFDIILAKLFLSPEVAGQYAFLSLIGKVIFFFGSLCNSLMVPYISKRIGERKESQQLFHMFIGISVAFVSFMFIGLGLLGWWTLPLIFGDKVADVMHYLLSYTIAMSLFTLTNTFIVYNLLYKRYIFPFSALTFSLLMIVGISIFHSGIADFVNILLVLSVFSIGFTLFLHYNGKFRQKIESKIRFLK